MQTIEKPNGKWYVLDEKGEEVAGPFETEEEALDWIELNPPTPPKSPTPGFRP